MRVYVHLSGKYNLDTEDIEEGFTVYDVLVEVGADVLGIRQGVEAGTVTIQLDGAEATLETPVSRENHLLVVAGEFEAG